MLYSMGSQRVGYDLATEQQQQFQHMITSRPKASCPHGDIKISDPDPKPIFTPETPVSCPDPSCDSVFSPQSFSSFWHLEISLISSFMYFQKAPWCVSMSVLKGRRSLSTTLQDPSAICNLWTVPVTTPLSRDLPHHQVSLTRFAQSIFSREAFSQESGMQADRSVTEDFVATLGLI